ncbi:MAG: chain length determinant protein tyrosine kinase EpsG [Proteobacteria bacterium]|nr:chain length determinant protein tyrosine kinase EpsG [Pseudomonadota bacterium]
MNSVFSRRSRDELPPDMQSSALESGGMLIGRVLFDAGKLTEIDVNRVVIAQRKKNLRFGEAAMRLGLVTQQDVEQALALQFGYPYVTADSSLDPTLVAAHEPFGATAEGLRELRSQLQLRWFNEKEHMLAICAPRKRSGCSHLAANLAISFAQLGERTLLIDANFRRPSQTSWFNVEPAFGLSHLLIDRCGLDEALVPIAPFSDLKVIFAGTQPPNPQELLSRVTFRYLLETSATNFDVVIVDTPPILEYSDAQLVVAATGGCLLAARRHKTRVADIERAREKLVPTRAAVLGAALVG